MSGRHQRATRIHPLPIVVSLILSAALAGCTGGPPPDDPQDEGDNGPSDGDPSAGEIDPGGLVPEEIGSLVQEVTGAAGVGEGAFGHAFDEETRRPIPGAKVVAQCHQGGLESPTGPQIRETDELGRFAFSAGGSLSGCDLVSYQALHPGLQQGSLLTGGSLEPGKSYLVLIGLRPSA